MSITMIQIIGYSILTVYTGWLIYTGLQEEEKRLKKRKKDKIVYLGDDDYWIKRDTTRQKEIRKILKEKWDKLPYIRINAGREKIGTSNFDKPFEYSKKKDGDLLERRINLAKNEIKNIWETRPIEKIPWTTTEYKTEDIQGGYGQKIGTKFITTKTKSDVAVGFLHFDDYVWEHRPLIKEYWEIELNKLPKLPTELTLLK